MVGVGLAVILTAAIVWAASRIGGDACERLAEGPIFQIVADHGVRHVPLAVAVERALAQAGMARTLDADDIRIVREEGRTTVATVDGFYALLDTSPDGYWAVDMARRCSSYAAEIGA